MMRTAPPLATANPRRYDAIRPWIQPRIREGGTVIQPIATSVRGIGFDLDWTLSYYPLSTADVLHNALARCDLPFDLLGDLQLAAEGYDRRWVELERIILDTHALRRRIVETLLEEAGASDLSTADPIASAYGEIRQETGVLAFPGVDRLLADLKGRYRLGLITNGPSQMQWEKIRTLGFDDLFDVILVAGDLGIYKPDGRIFERLSGKLGVAAHEVLFAGDTYDTDIVGAARAGMYTAWIGSGDPSRAGDVEPTLCNPHVAGLREILL